MTFLEKFDLIKKSVPVPATTIEANSIDCEYSDHAFRSKNCYYCFDAYLLENGLYTSFGWGKNIADSIFVSESEKCYQCVDCNKCHSCTYLLDCNNCNDCHFSAFLNSCSDCFGCVALTHKKYCIFNKQYNKEEYFKEIEELKKRSPSELLAQMLELKKKIPHPASQQANNVNSPYGDYIYNSKNCYWAFNVYYAEDSGYLYPFAGFCRNCWDMYLAGGNADGKLSELSYETVYTDTTYNCSFLTYSYNCTNCFYSSHLKNCTDCFGCVGLTNKKYCILNNQLTKAQYEKAIKDIKKELGWRI